MTLPIPKPPTADGNPPEYNAMKDLAERCAKSEAELERVTADRDSETKWAKQYHDDWVKVRDELERVQKQAVAYRDDLIKCREFVARFLVPWRHHLSESWLSGFEDAGCVVFDSIGFVKPKPTEPITAALQFDAGSGRNQPFTCFSCRDGNTPLYCLNCARDGYIRRDQVKPLMEALRFCESCNVTGYYGCVQKAVEHAKSLGL